MTQFLDDMETHYNGQVSKQFDRVYLKNVTECLTKWDDEMLIKSQEAAWTGIYSYWKSNGTANNTDGRPDYWGECSDK